MPAEFDLIRRWFTRSADAGSGIVALGVGDDAALLAPAPGMQLVTSVDTLVEGVHFPADTPAAAVGWKSLAANLSDLAAMGAAPRACLLALTLPRIDERWLDGFAAGFFRAADAYGCVLAGGDTTATPAGPAVITVTVFGELPAGTALLRSGARTGDLVCVSGTPGLAALGLARWQSGNRDLHDAAIDALLYPQPRLALGSALRGIASACIDVSDGLLGDLAHVLAASGVPGAEIDLTALPRAAALAALDDETACDHVLAGGDDYELCFTVAAERWPEVQAAAGGRTPVTVIGRTTAAPGIRCVDRQGGVRVPTRMAWEHFRGH
ncbi:MAG: thiamine-phosphate kinase [Pseudomonadota bacterium]